MTEHGPLSAELVTQWDEDGWCVVPPFFSENELRAAQDDVSTMFPTAEELAADPEAERHRLLRSAANALEPKFPFEGNGLNRLVVHDRVIALAEQLLRTPDVRLYQGMATAKYSEGAPDYDQMLHVDYMNHTLVVPRPDVGYQHLELFIYLSDVAADTAATRMVSRRSTSHIPVERAYLDAAEYGDLYAGEVPATGPAGSILAYRPDVYHRGVGLTRPGSSRFLLHVAYKPVGTDWLGYQSWPQAGEDLAWHGFVAQADVRQLTVLGFPEPGHPYWTAETLAGVAARYPLLDLGPWRLAREATTG